MMQKKQVHPVEYKSVTSRARTMETRSIAPQSAPVKWGRITPQGGFTLIEILVVMVIFTTSFLALAAGATTVMKSNHSSYNNTIATTLAQDKLEELMAGTVLPNCPAYTKTDPNCFNKPTTSSSMTFDRYVRITANAPVAGVTRIEIKLDWNDHTGHSLTLSSAVDL